MKSRTKIGLFAALFQSVVSVGLGHASTGTDGANFLAIPVGARPAALGSAYTALANDAYASVWNPAGLGFLSTMELAGQHLSYLESIHDEYLGFALPIGSVSGFGASAQYLGSGDIPSTDNFGNSIGDFSSYYAAYSVAYGRQAMDRVSVGITAKWINARIGDFSANAQSADVGVLARPSSQWNIGASVTNMGSKLKFLNTGDSLPLAGHLSAAFSPNTQWTVTAEAVHEASGLTSGRGGIEWKPIDVLALRAGYRSDTLKELSAIAGLTAGMGITLWGQELAYAWLPMGDLGAGHYFSFVARFGVNKEGLRNLSHGQPSFVRSSSHSYSPYQEEATFDELVDLLSEPQKDPLADRRTGSEESR